MSSAVSPSGLGQAGGMASPLVYLAHHRGPRRRRQHAALGVGLDLLRLVEADPDPRDQVGREADVPDVVAIVGGSGLPPAGKLIRAPTDPTAVPWRTTSRSASVISHA